MKKTVLLILLVGFFFSAYAQTTMRGKVVDKNTKEPLPGAAITVVGSTIGTSTSETGDFTLNVPEAAKQVTVSFIGYNTVTIAVTSNVVIEMESEVQAMEEVVVVGYGVMRKSDLTGSVAKVNVEDIRKVSTIDAAQAIQGRLAGVNVISNSGNPGAGTTIRVRGIGTINNSDPLYVVDGFPAGDISHIAPTDIESMEVLKDASATAIYGSRGANGVILVKTRTGTKGKKLEIQANFLGGVSQVGKTLELADATQFAAARKALGNTDDIINYVLDNQAAGNYMKGTDWQKEIFRKAVNQRYNVSVLGGSENYSFDHGITYSKQEGIVKGSYLDKVMLHTNNNFSLTKKVKLGMNINYVWYEKPGEKTDFYGGIIPGSLRSDPISAAWDNYTDFYGEIYYSQACTNPALGIWQNGYSRSGENRFIGNFYLQWDDIFVKGLSFRSQFGKQLNFSNSKTFSPKFFITPTQKNDDQTLYESRYTGNSWSNTNYFSYNRTVNKLNINSTLGMEVQAYRGSDIWAKGYDVPENADLQYLGAHKDIVKFDLGGGAGQNRLASGFFRSNFSWDNRFLLTGTIRLDGSSKFMSEKRWGYFPSFSGGWNIGNETFLGAVKNTLSNLKLRAGWGIVGNQGSAGDFDYVSSVNNGYVYAFNGVPIDGAIQRRLANRELTWESAEQYNLGLDFGLWNNSLSGSVDYFIRNTKDMILSRPIPIYAGKQRPNVNAGTMSNKGFEFTVNYFNSAFSEFKYNIGLNLTVINNEITSLAGGDPIRSGGVGRSGNTTKTEVGREIAYFYGYKTGGIFKTQEQLDAHKLNDVAIQPEAQLGDVIFQDLNGDGKITEADMTYLGSASPDFTGGLNINLSYKNIDMVVFMNGSYGNEIVNAMYQSLYSSRMFETNISRDMALNHWTPERPDTNVPRLTAADPNKNDERFSDRWVEDGSYLRIKNIQIGYTLPKSLLNKAHIQNMRIYASFDNMFTFTNYSGLDPELFGLYGNPFYYGVDLVNYPQPRTVSLGINISL